jgi:formylglycine-generating enzyme required for sulfatase activity
VIEGPSIRQSHSSLGEQNSSINLPTFWISEVTVTNALFQRFVDATGYVTRAEREDKIITWINQRFVEKPGVSWKNPYGNYTFPRDFERLPVTFVSWIDARNYCDWLSRTTGLSFRLPTTDEWEKAASGPEGWNYSWGPIWREDACNCCKPNLEKELVHVYSYENGVSPFGCYNMLGNVWEWCITSPQNGQKQIAETYAPNRDYYVRGGSFLDSKQHVSCFYQKQHHSTASMPNLGFRVMCDKL